jgi:hypothetical protein
MPFFHHTNVFIFAMPTDSSGDADIKTGNK